MWDLAVRDQPWIDPVDMAALRRSFDLTDLRPHAAAAGVDRTIVVQTVPEPEETPELLALAAQSDLVAAVVGWVDLTTPAVAENLARLREGRGGAHLAGIRHQVQDEPDPCWLTRPDVRRGIAAVGTSDLVYELLVVPGQLEAAIATARALPEVTFVLDHLGKPPISSGRLEPWASQVRALARESHVYCKLSGMVTEADGTAWTTDSIRRYADVVLDAFGPNRLMFGSDWPVCLLASDYGGVVGLAEELTRHLGEDERTQIFRHTAERVYQLHPRGEAQDGTG